MTLIDVEPIVLENVELTIGATNDYAAHVSRVEFVPSRSLVAWKGLSPAGRKQKATKADWVCNLEYAQDWTTPSSLSRYLYAHEGEEVPVTFMPEAGTGLPSWSTTLQIVDGAIGGAVDSIPVASVSMPCSRPVPDYDDDPLSPNPAD